MPPPALRGLLLDFDGTIADTERLGHRVAYNRAFAALGLGWEWDEPLYGDLLGVAGGKERIRHYLERFHPDMVEEAVASGLIPRIHQTKARLFAEIAPRAADRKGGYTRIVKLPQRLSDAAEVAFIEWTDAPVLVESATPEPKGAAKKTAKPKSEAKAATAAKAEKPAKKPEAKKPEDKPAE